VDGKILMRGREVTTVDEATVLDQANQALRRVITAIGYQN
jgi:hypothetical protein